MDQDWYEALKEIIFMLVITTIVALIFMYSAEHTEGPNTSNSTVCNKYITLAQANIPNGANLTSAWIEAPKQCGSDYSEFENRWFNQMKGGQS